MAKNWRGEGFETRTATLNGEFLTADTTSLKQLRRFVAALEAWPDNAKVRKISGAMLRVSTVRDLDPFVLEDAE